MQSFSAVNHPINNSKAKNINIAGFKDELALAPAFRELRVPVDGAKTFTDHPAKCPTCSPQAHACQGGCEFNPTRVLMTVACHYIKGLGKPVS